MWVIRRVDYMFLYPGWNGDMSGHLPMWCHKINEGQRDHRVLGFHSVIRFLSRPFLFLLPLSPLTNEVDTGDLHCGMSHLSTLGNL